MRTLPIKVAPLPGESLDSWLEFYSHRLLTRWGDFKVALNLGRRRGVSNAMVVSLNDDEASAIAYATGITAERVHEMTVSHYAGKAVGIDPVTGRFSAAFPWGRARGSRFCPYCLAETGGRWQLAWRLGWSFACVRHNCLLADRCYLCGLEQRHNGHGSQVIPEPGLCTNTVVVPSVARAHCGAELAATPVLRLPATHPVLLTQRRINDVIDTGTADFGVYASNPQPGRAVLADIRFIGRRTLEAWESPELDRMLPADILDAYRAIRRQPMPRTGQTEPRVARQGLCAPAQAEATAVAATAALGVLDAPDIYAAGAPIRWLVTRARPTGLPRCVAAFEVEQGKTPQLRAVELAAVGPLVGPVRELRYRIGTATPRVPPPYVGPHNALAQRVPTLLWPEWLRRLNVRRRGDLSLRAALCASIMIVGSRINVSEALALLRSPLDECGSTHILGHLGATEQWIEIRDTIYGLADYLTGVDTPIDYSRRRSTDYKRLLPAREWQHVRDRTDTRLVRSSVTSARVYLFERLSGMPAAPNYGVSREARFRAMKVMRRAGTTELVEALDEYGQRFLSDQGITDEPVYWSPDFACVGGFLAIGAREG